MKRYLALAVVLIIIAAAVFLLERLNAHSTVLSVTSIPASDPRGPYEVDPGIAADCGRSLTSWVPITNALDNVAYEKRDGRIYFIDAHSSSTTVPLNGADAGHFMVAQVTGSPYEIFFPFGKDTKHVYYEWRILLGADPSTFKAPFDEYCYPAER